MRVVIAGGSGFLGRALAGSCVEAGDTVVILTRRARKDDKGVTFASWQPAGDPAQWAGVLNGADALVNLAGESIASGRWTNARKVRLWDSRLQSTRALARAMTLAEAPPRRVVSASAVGYYGTRGDEVLTEEAPPGSDFLARLCVAWEQAAEAMASETSTVACVRSAMVLDAHDGPLPRMALPFRLGAGGRLGDGTQFMPWIHRDDWVRLVRHLLARGDLTGAFNAAAPEPLPNEAFAKTLARVLARPALVPAPAAALRLALGEMADALLLPSQRVIPARATADGFTFTYPTLYAALEQVYGRA